MFQRITELWPGLLRIRGENPAVRGAEANEQAQLSEEQRHAIEDYYATLQWTQVISVQEPAMEGNEA